MAGEEERLRKAQEVRAALFGPDYRGPAAPIPKELPYDEFVRLFPGWAFGEIYQRPFPDLKTRILLNLVILTALGSRQHELQGHIKAARHNNFTREQIIDVLLHVAIYAGIPACLEGLAVARQVFDEEDQR